MTKHIKLPQATVPESKAPTLPYDGNAVTDKSFAFSFSCFDRTHDYFNLGDNSSDRTISGKWFLDLFDCLREVCRKPIPELKHSMYDLHPVDWKNANVHMPESSEQLDYQQFRINKGRGRVIGFKIDNLFYIVWLDPHHNLSDSDGYGTATKYRTPESEFEKLVRDKDSLEEENNQLRADLQAAEELLGKSINGS